MSEQLLIYGANGYTGELVARRAVERGLRPTLAGRSAEAVGALAQTLGLPHLALGLDDPARLDDALHGRVAVLRAPACAPAQAGWGGRAGGLRTP